MDKIDRGGTDIRGIQPAPSRLVRVYNDLSNSLGHQSTRGSRSASTLHAPCRLLKPRRTGGRTFTDREACWEEAWDKRRNPERPEQQPQPTGNLGL